MRRRRARPRQVEPEFNGTAPRPPQDCPRIARVTHPHPPGRPSGPMQTFCCCPTRRIFPCSKQQRPSSLEKRLRFSLSLSLSVSKTFQNLQYCSSSVHKLRLGENKIQKPSAINSFYTNILVDIRTISSFLSYSARLFGLCGELVPLNYCPFQIKLSACVSHRDTNHSAQFRVLSG